MMFKRNEKLIKTKLWQYLLPSVLLTASLQIGNVVDTMLVGNILGTDAMSAVQIGMTVDNIMELAGYVLAVGGSVAAGMLLGRREREFANRVFSTTFTLSAAFGAVFSVLSVFSPIIAKFLTGGGELENDVCAFVRVTLLGAPVIGIVLQFINYVAVDNHPGIASAYVITSNVLNLSLDYLLLSFTKLGTAGAALSTILGYALAGVVLIPYLRSPKRMLRFTMPKKMSESLKMVLSLGMPTLLYMICDTVRIFVLNMVVVHAIGSDAMAVYTVCNNIVLILEMFVGGIIGTLSSIGGALYGEKDYFGVRALAKNVLIFSYTVLAVFMAATFVFMRQVMGFFGIDGGALMDMTAASLRIFMLCLPFYLFNSFMTSFYQSTEKEKLSSFVTSLRSCVAVLPPAFLLVFLTPPDEAKRLRSLMIALVLGEVLTVIAVTLVRRLRYRGKDIFLLPEERDERVLDFSIGPDMKETLKVPVEISEFCQSCGIEAERANLIAVAAEEMTVNIILYGGKHVKSIDINLSITPESLILRTRDNGIPFDPTHYESDNERFEIHGIELVKRISSKVQYMRVLDLNNTTVEVALDSPEVQNG